jgi:hypothetical protein
VKLELASDTLRARMSSAWVGSRYGLESSLSQGLSKPELKLEAQLVLSSQMIISLSGDHDYYGSSLLGDEFGLWKARREAAVGEFYCCVLCTVYIVLASCGSLHCLGRWSLGPLNVDANLQFSLHHGLRLASPQVIAVVQNAPIVDIHLEQ